jgi:hypothetical protein
MPRLPPCSLAKGEGRRHHGGACDAAPSRFAITPTRSLPAVFTPAARIALPALALALAAFAMAWTVAPAGEPGTAAPRLAHMVFFSLKDHSPASRERFVASCHKYLAGHPGTAYFSVGTIAEDVEEPVSVRDFDVALHLVFEGKSDRDRYLKDPRHVKFVEENKEHFAKVRVFDSYVQKS